MDIISSIHRNTSVFNVQGQTHMISVFLLAVFLTIKWTSNLFIVHSLICIATNGQTVGLENDL